ncbi:MAG: hypothetical protein EAZ08_00185 [Cytophagales bacterium]|nr:MAG: hypothetical protein EAZ08_00185 [Cytophagales bacterium]
MTNVVELTKKLVELLEQVPIEVCEAHQRELLKIMPTEKSEVILKIGSGTFPEEHERSIGIFVQISHAEPASKEYSLTMLWQTILQSSTHDDLEFLDKILDSFESEASTPYEMRFTPAVFVREHIGCSHFSLIGKITEKDGRRNKKRVLL